MTDRQRELSRIRAEYDRVAKMTDAEYDDACKRVNVSAKVFKDLMRRQVELGRKERRYATTWKGTPWD